MRSKTKKLLITTEKHEILIIRAGAPQPVSGYCPACEKDVEMLTLDSAVIVSAMSGREMIGRIATDEIHAIESVNGPLLICKDSLIYPDH